MKGKWRKRITYWAVVLCMMAFVCVPVLAEGIIQPVRVFVYENTLYAYLEMEGVDRPITQAEAKVGEWTIPAVNRLETVRQAGFPITYLLLVDNSTSMPPFREQLVEFGNDLAQNSGSKTRFILATLGDSFQILDEDVPAERVGEQLSAMPFDEKVTRLHTCINDALDYFETLPRQGTELRELVILTDAVQYDPAGGVPYQELAERIQRSDVLLHSLGFGTDAAALENLGKLTEASGGIHQELTETLTAEDAAATLLESAGSLIVTGFDLEGCTVSGEDLPVSFTFASRDAFIGKVEAVADIPEQESSEASEKADKTEAEIESKSEEESEEEPGLPNVPSELETAAPDRESAALKPAEPASGLQKDSALPVGICTAAAALVIVAVVLIFRSRKKVPPSTCPAEAENSGGIYIRFAVQDENLAPKKTEFTLIRELTIGSGLDCDLVLKDKAIPLQAVRLFLNDGFVYMEVLRPDAVVLVNDKPTERRQKLRSGDCISIAGVVFRPMF